MIFSCSLLHNLEKVYFWVVLMQSKQFYADPCIFQIFRQPLEKYCARAWLEKWKTVGSGFSSEKIIKRECVSSSWKSFEELRRVRRFLVKIVQKFISYKLALIWSEMRGKLCGKTHGGGFCNSNWSSFVSAKYKSSLDGEIPDEKIWKLNKLKLLLREEYVKWIPHENKQLKEISGVEN